MINNTKKFFIVLLLGCITISCSGDYLTDYFKTEIVEKNDARNSYFGQFKAFWIAMDCNYPHWDYEERYGLDWDEIYKKYEPFFIEFDTRMTEVADEELVEEVEGKYKEIISLLHDGHIDISIQSIPPGQYSFAFAPLLIKNRNREDYDSYPRIDTVFYKPHISDLHKQWDSFCCRINDNIAYYYPYEIGDEFTEFAVWEKWYEMVKSLNESKELKGIIIDLRNFGGGNTKYYHYLLGYLKPASSDYPGFHNLGWIRYKSGLGRFDYAPIIPWLLKYNDNYKVDNINVPIVVLSNCHTASLGEIVSLNVKEMSNGCLIGKQTWGGLSPITSVLNVDQSSVHNSSLSITMPNGTFLSHNFEFLEGVGVSPDIEQDFDKQIFEETGRDTQLERALEYIRTGK